MKFSVEKNNLQTAVSTASRASAVKSAVPSLEGLLIEAAGDIVKISGYDLKTGIVTSFTADIQQEGRVVFKCKAFW